jgi:cytoskeletal protein CcmA (bactofilin family)
LIGKSLILTGKISGREDLLVDGRIEGDVDLPENKLTVGAGGHVQGSIRAREVVVFGTVHGNMEAVEKVEIKRNARVLGDMRTARPVIEEEAYFKGNIETVRAEPPKTGLQRAASEAPGQPALPAGAPAQIEPRSGEPRKG